MGIAIVLSREQRGIDAPQVRVEVDIGSGLPAFNIVGLPEAVVKESKDRVRSALCNSDFQFPCGRITVNLAPADLTKEGGRFDLPIAIGILIASGQLTDARCELNKCEIYGELSLSGELRSMKAVLPAALAASISGHSVILPHINASEAALVKGCEVIAARHILEVCAHFAGTDRLEPFRAKVSPVTPTVLPDLRDSRAAARQARVRNCCRRSTQPVVDRIAGGWEEHARAAAVWDRAADERRGSHRGGGAPLDRGSSTEAERVARAAISQSAPHGLGRGPCRWRFPPAAGRDFSGS